MLPVARWVVVGVLAVGVTAPPAVARMWPAHSDQVDLTTLAAAVAGSQEVPWSGEVRSRGSLDLPVSTSAFEGLSRLLGETTTLRVWWRAPDDWRVDRMRSTGETDTLRDGGLSVKWNYETGTARFNAWSTVRLPDDLDVLPSSLASRLYAGARPAELSALPAKRIAGHSGTGVRLRPADPRSSIRQVDVWADPATGLPLRTDVYGEGTHAALSTELVALHLRKPSAASTGFELGSGLYFVQGTSLDDAATANAFAPFVLPGQVADLQRRGRRETYGAVGVYGRGATALVALPLRSSIAEQLGEQLMKSRSATRVAGQTVLEAGPLSVLLVQSPRINFLLVGTVTQDTLRLAAADLLRNVVRTR